jgi:hypothetical protein
MYNMELPRDVKLSIVRKMDIDTRRCIGIFSKLKVPSNLRKHLEKVLFRNMVLVHCYDHIIYTVPLPNHKNYHNGQRYKYVLQRTVYSDGHCYDEVLQNAVVCVKLPNAQIANEGMLQLSYQQQLIWCEYSESDNESGSVCDSCSACVNSS